MARVLLVDNFDSFTFNLVQYLQELGHAVDVVRNDEDPDLDHDLVVISPGPGTPAQAGLSNRLLREAPAEMPILGICLGHQCIAEVFGGKVVRADYPMHGKTSDIYHNSSGLFEGLPSPFKATRYHSLIVDQKGLPDELVITATTSDGQIMALQHRTRPIHGVQFHPESILTEHGQALLANFGYSRNLMSPSGTL